jgi:hypothetical protein
MSKLVDILARELVEWPKRAEYTVQDADGRCWAGAGNARYVSAAQGWSTHEEFKSFRLPSLATDHATAIVTREQWHAERRRIEVADKHAGKWTGEGLPPVGAPVMFESNQCEVIGYHDGLVVCAMDDDYENGCYDGFSARDLKPIRTPREKWIEAAHAEGCPTNIAALLFDASLARLPD